MTAQSTPYPITTEDSDGDGISDVLEILAGTDPHNAADFPSRGGAIILDKFTLNLNFARETHDTLTATVRFQLPPGFKSDGATVSVLFGNATERAKLDAKGKGGTGGVSMLLKHNKAPEPLAAPTGALLKLTVKNAALQAAFAELANKTTDKAGEPHSLQAALATDSNGAKFVFVGDLTVLYKAVQGKTGKAAKSGK